MPYDQKLHRYLNRTVEHIHRVQKNMLYLISECAEELKLTREQCRGAMWNVMNHDRSKFSEKQFEPYIELTAYYDVKRYNKAHKYPSEEIEKQVDEAVQDHYMQENHHPEKYKGLFCCFTHIECLEIICDLQAMAQEFNEGSCREFFMEKWKPKHGKYFQPDDAWYWSSLPLMEKAIECFERQAKDNQ